MSTTIDQLIKYNQTHVMDNMASNVNLRSLANVDLDKVLGTFRRSMTALDECVDSAESISELPVMDLQQIKEKESFLYTLGSNPIKEQRVAVVILSGGQGSRLGYNHAKGMLDIGITKSVSIFQLLIEKLKLRTSEMGKTIPVFIMTSNDNHNEIVCYFAEHNYFDYPKDYIEFFKQGELPALDLHGNIYITPNRDFLMLPSGNGDWYTALVNSSILNKMQYQAVEWFNVVSVDNPLQNMADPIFLGATLYSKCKMGAKVLKKVSPEEKIGMICRKNGIPGIIEYYDIPESIRYAKNESGEYKYQYGVSLNYVFNKAALDNILNSHLPLHYVPKNVRISPHCTVKLIKLETLICDIISFFETVCIYEIDRNSEFAPIKNKEGADSIDTARILLKHNGVAL